MSNFSDIRFSPVIDTGSVKHVNYTHERNVLYPSTSMSTFTMIINFCLMKGNNIKFEVT